MEFALKRYKADLHLHTCLSPCADIWNTPKRLIEKAKEGGIHIIGICDHNSAENVASALRYAEKYCPREVTVVPGMEITTAEEIHLLGLFDNLSQALEMQSFVYARLTGKNDPEVFGEQIIVNEDEEVLGFNDLLLSSAVSASLEEVIDRIHLLGGIAVAAHVDRPSFSVISQLGVFPEGAKFDAVEISSAISLEEARQKFPEIERFPVITSSDAHYLHWIGNAATEFLLAKPGLNEISLALKQKDGRRILME